MTPWYFYLLFFSSIFVVTIELLHPVGNNNTQGHTQDWHHVKCKCGYCEDVHDIPVKKLTMH